MKPFYFGTYKYEKWIVLSLGQAVSLVLMINATKNSYQNIFKEFKNSKLPNRPKNQPESQIMFDKNSSPRDWYTMTFSMKKIAGLVWIIIAWSTLNTTSEILRQSAHFARFLCLTKENVDISGLLIYFDWKVLTWIALIAPKSNNHSIRFDFCCIIHIFFHFWW